MQIKAISGVTIFKTNLNNKYLKKNYLSMGSNNFNKENNETYPMSDTKIQNMSEVDINDSDFILDTLNGDIYKSPFFNWTENGTDIHFYKIRMSDGKLTQILKNNKLNNESLYKLLIAIIDEVSKNNIGRRLSVPKELIEQIFKHPNFNLLDEKCKRYYDEVIEKISAFKCSYEENEELAYYINKMMKQVSK